MSNRKRERNAHPVTNVRTNHGPPTFLNVSYEVAGVKVGFTSQSSCVCPECKTPSQDNNTVAVYMGSQALCWCPCGCIWMHDSVTELRPVATDTIYARYDD